MTKRSPLELVLLSLFLTLTPMFSAMFGGMVVFVFALPVSCSMSWSEVGAYLGFATGLACATAVAHKWFPPSRAFGRSYLAIASLIGVIVGGVCAHASGPLTIDSDSGVPPTMLDIAGEALALALTYGGMCAAALVVLWARRRELYD